MTQFIVFQAPPPVSEGMQALDPQPVMAALTEAESASQAIQNVVSIGGSFASGDPLSALNASSAAQYNVAVTAKATSKS